MVMSYLCEINLDARGLHVFGQRKIVVRRACFQRIKLTGSNVEVAISGNMAMDSGKQ